MTDRAWGGPAFDHRVRELNQTPKRTLVRLLDNLQKATVIYRAYKLTQLSRDELIREILREEGFTTSEQSRTH